MDERNKGITIDFPRTNKNSQSGEGMKAIYKYEFKNRIVLPVNSIIISIGIQRIKEVDTAFIWAFVDTEIKHCEMRKFLHFGTGWEIESVLKKDEKLRFIGTLHFKESGLVFHYFEAVKVFNQVEDKGLLI